MNTVSFNYIENQFSKIDLIIKKYMQVYMNTFIQRKYEDMLRIFFE